jgi:hypothetical protein
VPVFLTSISRISKLEEDAQQIFTRLDVHPNRPHLSVKRVANQRLLRAGPEHFLFYKFQSRSSTIVNPKTLLGVH